jgi:hypothetical protein
MPNPSAIPDEAPQPPRFPAAAACPPRTRRRVDDRAGKLIEGRRPGPSHLLRGREFPAPSGETVLSWPASWIAMNRRVGPVIVGGPQRIPGDNSRGPICPQSSSPVVSRPDASEGRPT